MHPKKCNQMIFNINSNRKINEAYTHRLFSETIPSCENLKFLGVTFDLGLTFNSHVQEIKKKSMNRLNIIKIISNRNYKLNKKTLKTTYLALIRSKLDYSSLIIPCIPKTLGKLVQSTQNMAMRIIYKLKYDSHTDDIVKLSGIPRIATRAQELNENFLKNCKKFENELIAELIQEYKEGGFNFKNKTFLCLYRTVI